MNSTQKNDRVELIYTSDPVTRVVAGALGTVYLVDSLGHVYVRWDDGGVLRLVMAEDQWRRVS